MSFRTIVSLFIRARHSLIGSRLCTVRGCAGNLVPAQIQSVSTWRCQKKARKARAARRLLEFNANKRKELLLASSRVRTFLRQFRRERVQLVWTAWMRGETPEPAVEPMEA